MGEFDSRWTAKTASTDEETIFRTKTEESFAGSSIGLGSETLKRYQAENENENDIEQQKSDNNEEHNKGEDNKNVDKSEERERNMIMNASNQVRNLNVDSAIIHFAADVIRAFVICITGFTVWWQ